jgi:hypothetical protein
LISLTATVWALGTLPFFLPADSLGVFSSCPE